MVDDIPPWGSRYGPCILCQQAPALHYVSHMALPQVCDDCLLDIPLNVHRCCATLDLQYWQPPHRVPDDIPYIIPPGDTDESRGLDLAAYIVREVGAA